jgi:hypothetical protein
MARGSPFGRCFLAKVTESEPIVESKGRQAAVYRTLLAVGLLTWVILALSIDNGHVGVFHDDGIYLVSAQAIRDGRGYQLPSRPGNPPPKYPIGFPLAIATVMRCLPGPATLPRDIAAARTLVIASGLVFFLAAHRWLRRVRVPEPGASWIVLATALHPACLVGCASAIFSDLTFCALTYLVLLGLTKPCLNRLKGPALSAVLAGALAGAGSLVRSNGVTLILATLLALGRHPRHRPFKLAGSLLGMAMVIGGAWLVPGSSYRAVPSGDYRLEMKAAWSSPWAGVEIVGRNLSAVVLDLPTRVLLPMTSYISPVRQALAGHPAAALGLRLGCPAVVLVGLIRLARGGRGRAFALWVHALATLVLFLIWPWTMIMDRFLLGLFPLVLLAFWAGIAGLLRTARGLGLGRLTSPSRFALGVMAVVTLGIMAVSARSVLGFHAAGRQWPGASNRRSLSEALALIHSRLEPDAVIAARWPDTVFLYTGRQSVPLTEDDAILLGRFDQGDRLGLWIDLVPGRPFYLLVRGQTEDGELADRRQAESLSRTSGMRLEPFLTTSDGRYELLRVIRL